MRLGIEQSVGLERQTRSHGRDLLSESRGLKNPTLGLVPATKGGLVLEVRFFQSGPLAGGSLATVMVRTRNWAQRKRENVIFIL